MAALLLPLFRHAARTAAPVPDTELLDRFVTGRDESAFAELVRRHGPVVYRVCRRLVGSDADDAFQASFLVLATRPGAARAAASVGGWLVGVAGRVARQMRRAKGRRARHEAGAATKSRPSELPDATTDLTDQFRALDEELARLPDRLRDPIVLCLLQGMTQEQAAAEIGRDARTLRRRLERAKQVLRARLERRGVVPAVASALVTGAGSVSAAMPRGLSERTVATAFDFLTGGAGVARTVPVVLAKGVASTMFARKVMHLMAAAVAALVGLGVVMASDEPKPSPPTAPAARPAAAKAADAGKPAPQIRIEALCMEVPGGFCDRVGLTDDDQKPGMASNFLLSRREARMLTALFRAEREAGYAKNLAHPLIMTQDNRAGFFQIGTQYPYQTSEAATKDGKTVTAPKINFMQIGQSLKVTPKISADGKFLQLDIETTHMSVSPTPVNLGNGTNAPVFTQQTVRTNVVTPDGGTVVMLGCREKRDIKTEVKVAGDPGPSKIVTNTISTQLLGEPFVGDAGQLPSKIVTNTISTQLLWMVTAHIVRDGKHIPNAPAELIPGTDRASGFLPLGAAEPPPLPVKPAPMPAPAPPPLGVILPQPVPAVPPTAPVPVVPPAKP